MGKVFLKIRKPGQTTQDGIPTDAIASAECDPKTHEVDVTGTDPNNSRIALCNKVKVYSASKDAGGTDITTSKGIEIVGIVVTDDDDGKDKLEELRVIKRGSGISGTPEARILLKGKSDYNGTQGTDYVVGTELALGGGDPETQLVLISEDGQDAPNVNGLFINLTNEGKLPDDIKSSTGESDGFATFFEDGDFANVQELKIFDPYQKKIDYKDIKDFASGPLLTALGQYHSLSSIKQVKSQTAQVNKKAEAAAEQARQINITLKAKYESDKIIAEQQALEDYYAALEAYQSDWGITLTQYSISNDPGGTIVDPVWNAAVQAVDNWFDLIEAMGGERPTITNFSPNESWIQNLENATGQLFPSLGEASVSEPRYLNESWSPLQYPEHLDTYEKIAKGYLIKTICFAAIATLGGIFSRLSGSGTAWSKGSSEKVTYSARVWRENTEDGLSASWFKSSMRSHDLFAHLLTMFASIGSVVKSVGNRSEYPGVSEENFKRLEALTREIAAAGYIESLKQLYELLGKWVNFYTVKKSNFSNQSFGFNKLTDFKQFIQKLEIIRGRIAVHLDGIAYSWQHSAILYGQSGSPKNQQPQISLIKKSGRGAKSIDKVSITNQGVIPPGGALGGGLMGTAALGKAGMLSKWASGEPYELPTYGLQTVSTLPNVDFVLANSISSATIVNAGGDDFYWPNPSAVVRVPPNWWFDPGPKAKEILVLDSTEPAGTASLSEADPGGGSEEINDPNISGGLLFAKWSDIFSRLEAFSADVVGDISSEQKNFERVIKALGLNSSDNEELTGDAATFSSLIEIALYTPKIGDCSNSSIQKIDDELAKTFFRDPGAYAIKIAPQKAKESICNKQSCGVAHVYTKPPMVDELPEAPMCGNVTVKYNFHPTAEYRLTNAQAGGFFAQLFGTDNSVAITTSLRIKGASASNTGDKTWSGGRAAAQDGDMTLPAVFGNYTFAFENADEGFSLGSLFSSIISTLTFGVLGGTLKDPRITVPISAYHQALLVSYNANRLFAGESYTVGNGNPHLLDSPSSFTPAKVNLDPDEAWSPQDSANFRKNHIDSLKVGYQAVADAGGYYHLKKALADNSVVPAAREITPLLSAQQTFSGICFPVVKQWDIAKRPFRFTIDSGPLYTWGPTSNDIQRHEELSIGRADGGLPGAPHLPKFGELGSPLNTAKGGGGAGYRANHDVFISETPDFADLYRRVKSKANELSAYITRFEIEDISIFTEVAEKGLLAGEGNPLSQAIVDGNTTEYLQDNYCIDVDGYVKEATKARGSVYEGKEDKNGSYLNPDNGNHEAWDSNNLKKKFKVPHYVFGYALGNDYVSGTSAISTGDALTDARAQYTKYQANINVFHLTGHHIFKDGVATAPVATFEKTAYSNTTSNAATAAAENLLIAESEWNARVGQTDSQGNPLARSGVKNGFPTRVTATWNGETWTPIEPAIVGSQTKHITGKGHNATAANAHFTSLRASACNEGELDGVISNTVTFSGSITGVGSTNTTALTNAMNALNTYSNTQYNLFGTGLNVARTSPVNTAGTDAHNFFTTGATTYDGTEQKTFTTGCSGISLNSHGYKTNNFDNVAKFQWAKIVDGILEGHWCNAGGTCHGITENTNDTGILASGIAGNLFSCTVTVIDPTGTHSSYGQIVPNPSNVYSQYGIDNFWKSISGLRNKKYQEARDSLQREEWSSNWTTSVGGSGIHNDYYANRVTGGAYSFSDIQNGNLAVYPNSGALRRVSGWNGNVFDNKYAYSDIPAEGNSWPSVSDRTAWWANEYSDLAQAALVSQVESTQSDWHFTVNLKNYTAGSGDIDIWVDEYVQFTHAYDELPATHCTTGLGNGYNNYYASGEGSASFRDVLQYSWRTAIFKPKDANNLKLGEQPTECTVVGGVTSTTPLTAPTIITGSGRCNIYDDDVWKSVVTGDYMNTEAKAFIPLLRNTYSAKASISGSIPTITGVCDWSSSSRQTWEDVNFPKAIPFVQEVGPSEISSNWGTSLYKPQIEEKRVDEGEKYYIKYEDGIEGLQSSWIKTGDNKVTQTEKPLINLYASNNNNPTTSPHGENSLSTSVVPFGRQNPLDLSNITEAVTNDVRKQESIYMLGGWPVKNQASTETDIQKTIEGEQFFSAFSDEYVIVLSDQVRTAGSSGPRAVRPDWSPNTVLRGVWKNLSLKKKAAFLRSEKARGFVENVRLTQSNIENIDTGTLKITYDKNSNKYTMDFEGKTYQVDATKANSYRGKPTVPEAFYTGVTFFFYKISYNAAACQACVSTPAEDIVDKEVLVYHENYLQYAQVDWQMRSGDYQFEVPYVEPGAKVVVDGTEIIAKHWSEYITADFVKNSNTYTGEWTAYGQAFPGRPTQLGCPEEHDQASKLNKIVDYQVGFGKDYSYRKMKDVKNEIDFDGYKNKNKSNTNKN